MSIIKNYQPAKGTCKVTFTYPANSNIKVVQVLGDFNNWDSNKAPKMKKSKDEFNTVLELKTGKSYEFKYLVNGENWDNDFGADNYSHSSYSGTNNSVVILDKVESATKAPAAAAVKKSVITKTASDVSKPAVAKKTATPKAKVAKVAAPKAKVTKVATPKVAKPTTAKVATAKVAKPAVAKVTKAPTSKKVAAKVVKEDTKK